MPKFHVKETFDLPDRKLFVMAGSILEGEIQPGMSVHIRCNPSFDITAPIHSIETALRQGVEDVCLCIQSDHEEADFLSAFNIRDETLEVTKDGSQ